MQFTKEIINGKSMSATRVNQNRRGKNSSTCPWLITEFESDGWRFRKQNQNQNQDLWSSAPVKDPEQLIMGLRENENEREVQKPDNDNAAFCSAFIQLQTTGHSLKMGAPCTGPPIRRSRVFRHRGGISLYAVFSRGRRKNVRGNRFPAQLG